MMICFADESTTPPKPGQKRRPPYFIIAGVFIPISQWHEIANEVQRLKDSPEFSIRGEIKWRYFGRDNDDPKNTVGHLAEQERNAFRDAFFDILRRRNSVKAVAAVANVANCYKQAHIKDEHDLYGYTYKPISERFQYHLQDISRSIGTQQLGLIVSDHRGRKDDERMRREHQKLIHAQSQYISSYDNLVESIFLTPSHNSVGIQFADMIAGAVGRKYNSDDTRWFDNVRPIIREHPNGSIDGYGIIKVPNNW